MEDQIAEALRQLQLLQDRIEYGDITQDQMIEKIISIKEELEIWA